MSYNPEYHIPHIRHKRRGNEYLRLKEALNRKLRRVFHGCERKTAVPFIGCDSAQLRRHLKSQFKKGMTFKNYGHVWHIDHRKPCVSFDLNDPVQRLQCYHYTNLAPCFAFENISKKDKRYDNAKTN